MQLNEAQHTIDKIREVLVSDDGGDAEMVHQLAQLYNRAVKQINERLKECEALLRKGFRSEALQKCELEPKLLDLVALLDFPEAGVWEDYLVQLGGQRPEALRTELAEELNEAYSSQMPIAELLRKHRLLALARAPLPNRIAVMRRISEIDRDNRIWPEFIRGFERTRHQQIKEELAAATAAHDLNRLQQVQRELLDSEWYETPPRSLIDYATRSLQTTRQVQAREELKRIAEELTSAYALQNIVQAKLAAEEWSARTAEADLSDKDNIRQLVDPALAWLETQDKREVEQSQHERVLAELEHALDEGASRIELDRLRYAALRHEGGMPELLEQRLQERLTLLENSEHRRMVIHVSVLVLLGILGLILLLVFVPMGD